MRRGLDGELAGVEADEFGGEEKAESAGGFAVGGAGGQASERLEEGGHFLRTDARAGVGDFAPDAGGVVAEGDADGAALRRVVDRVAQEIGEDLLEAGGLGGNEREGRRRFVERQRLFFLRGVRAEVGGDLRGDAREVGGDGAKLEAAGVDRGPVDEIVDEVDHAGGFGAHGAGERQDLGGLVGGFFEEVGGRADGRERGLEVVGGEVEETALEDVGLLGGVAGGAGVGQNPALGAEAGALDEHDGAEDGEGGEGGGEEREAGVADAREVGGGGVQFGVFRAEAGVGFGQLGGPRLGGGGLQMVLLGEPGYLVVLLGDVEQHLQFGRAVFGGFTGHGLAFGKFAAGGGEGRRQIAPGLVHAGEPAVGVGAEAARVDGGGVALSLGDEREGFVEAAQFHQHLGEVAEGAGQLGLAAERAALGEDGRQGGEGLLGAAFREVEHRQRLFDIGEIGAVALGASEDEGALVVAARAREVAEGFLQGGEALHRPADGLVVAELFGEGEGALLVIEGMGEVSEPFIRRTEGGGGGALLPRGEPGLGELQAAQEVVDGGGVVAGGAEVQGVGVVVVEEQRGIGGVFGQREGGAGMGEGAGNIVLAAGGVAQQEAGVGLGGRIVGGVRLREFGLGAAFRGGRIREDEVGEVLEPGGRARDVVDGVVGGVGARRDGRQA